MLSVTVAMSPLIKPDSKAASSAITAESLNVFSAARAKDSEIFTANPPSDISWADFIKPSLMASKHNFWTDNSESISKLCNGPSIFPCINFRYSEPPNVVFMAPIERIKIQENEPLRSELKEFIDCIYSRKSPLTDHEEAVKVLNKSWISCQPIGKVWTSHK